MVTLSHYLRGRGGQLSLIPMDLIAVALLILIYIVVCLIEHKQKMEHLEFEEKVYKLRQQFLDAQRNNDTEKESEEDV